MNPFGNIGNIMKQAKEMQDKLKTVQSELAATQIVGTSGAGMVKIVMNGSGEALNMSINPEALKEGLNILQGLILAAINDANHKRELHKKEIMSKFMSGMGLPDGLDLLTPER